MQARTVQWLRGGALAAILGLVGYGIGSVALANQRGNATVAVTAADQVLNLSGPYTHENLAIYVLRGAQQDGRNFITLREGIDAKNVAVKEKAQEEVNEVVIENNSDDYLFLQEGDIIKGGKQDRTIYASLIIPPRQKEEIKVFCVEQSRWTAGVGGGNFGNADNPSLAPKDVRQAAKYQNDQSAVWANVALQRQAISNSINVASPNAPAIVADFHQAQQRDNTEGQSSLNTATDNAAAKRVASEFRRALEHALDMHPDAVGVAIVVNGQLEEVNVYPNKQLLEKQFPRLLGSYALQARMTAKDAKAAPAMSPSAVARQMHQRSEEQTTLAAVEFAPGATNGGQGLGFGGNLNMNDVELFQAGAVDPAVLQRLQGGRQQAINRLNAPMPAATTINMQNSFQVQEDFAHYKSVTQFQGKPVHVQYMSRTQQPAAPAAQRPAGQPALQIQQPIRPQVEQRLNPAPVQPPSPQ